MRPTAALDRRPGDVGNPINALTGAKTQLVDTGFGLLGLPLYFRYSTLGQLAGSPVLQPSSLGKLWNTTFHRALVISSNATLVTAVRGIEDAQSFVLVNTTYLANVPTARLRLESIAGGYRLSELRTGVVETYGATGVLLSREMADGSYITFQYGLAGTPQSGLLLGATDSNGRSISFTYKPSTAASSSALASNTVPPASLIATISDSLGRIISVGYDGNDNVTSLTWPDGQSRHLMYGNASYPWALTGLIDEMGVQIGTYGYDGSGHAISTAGVNGYMAFGVNYNSPPTVGMSTYTHPLMGASVVGVTLGAPTGTTVTLPNGQSATMAASALNNYMALTGQSQPAGSGCAAASSSNVYDTSGNLLSNTDFAGMQSCYGYDVQNRLTTLVEGLNAAAGVACTSVLSNTAILPAGAHRYTYQYHPDWDLPVLLSGPTSTSYLLYQGQSSLLDGAMGNCTGGSAVNYSNGKPIPLLCAQTVVSASDASSSTVSYTYDGSGHMTAQSDAKGNTAGIHYVQTPTSLQTGSTDADFFNVVLLMHTTNTINSTSFVDSSSVSNTFAPINQPTLFSGRSLFGGLGASIQFNEGSALFTLGYNFSNFWDSSFTLEFAALPDTPSDGVQYAVLGNRDTYAGTSAPAGAAVSLVYTASQLSQIVIEYACATNASGVCWTGVGLNNAGFAGARSAAGTFDRISIVGNHGTFVFYLNGTLVGLGAVNDTSRLAQPRYSGIYLGAAGSAALGPYFFRGYLDELRVTVGAARYVRSYTLTSTPFANTGAASAYMYDVAGITDRLGAQTFITSRDVLGRALSIQSPNGTVSTLSYTPRGQLASVSDTSSSGAVRTISYTYNAASDLTGISNPDGTTITISYDPNHMVSSMSDTQGNVVLYTHDAMGNVTSEQTKDPQGNLQRSITRSFDALNRVQQVSGARAD